MSCKNFDEFLQLFLYYYILPEYDAQHQVCKGLMGKVYP